MPLFCAVVNCGNKSAKTTNIGYYRIPAARTYINERQTHLAALRRQKWIQALKRADLTESKLKYARVCSRHFHSGKPADLENETSPDWVPSLHMGYHIHQMTSPLSRFKRLQRRDAMQTEVLRETTTPPEPVTDATRKPTYEELQSALEEAKAEIIKLKKELRSYRLEEEHFVENEEDVSYFTGFPEYAYLQNVLKLVEPHLPQRPKISKFQQLVLVLVKLRLNFHFKYLAKIFQCHRTTVSRVFECTIEVLYYRLKSFVHWPQRENLVCNTPACFKNNFGEKVTVIIDCFEVFIQKPSSLDAAAKTWSNYKHHHTIKFLIGISSHGCIIFISNAYGGRASDKYITEHSGFLDNLIPGDLVLADRGFSIDDSVRIYCAEVKYPSFLKGRKQLEAREVEETRKIANVRIHIERVIGQLKGKFGILQGTFPIKQLKKTDEEGYAIIDKIIKVCCSIINICPGIVPIDQ